MSPARASAEAAASSSPTVTLGGGRARLSARSFGVPRGGVSPLGSPSRVDRETARADFPRMHARFLWGSAAELAPLALSCRVWIVPPRVARD